MLIRVSDCYELRLPPERATLTLTVATESGEKGEAVAQATETLAALTARVRDLLSGTNGPITTFSQGQLHTSAVRPWNQDGNQLPFVYHTNGTMTVRFSDFAALSAFVEEVALWPFVQVQGVNWELTNRTLGMAQGDAQAEVVRRVTEKALRYATAAGATEMVPTILADPGLLSVTPGAGSGMVPMPMVARATMAAPFAAESANLNFQPEDITITAAVEAEFEAS